MDSRGVIKYSTRIDAADLSDGQRTCCKLPLRWGTLVFGVFFVAAGLLQIAMENYGFVLRKSTHQIMVALARAMEASCPFGS